MNQIRAWTRPLLTIHVLGRPGKSLSGCEQGTKVARVCENRSEKSSYEDSGFVRPVSWGCAGLNRATVSSVNC